MFLSNKCLWCDTKGSGGGCVGIPARFARDDGFGDINLCLWFKETLSLRRCDTWWISERGATDRLWAKNNNNSLGV